MFRAICSKSNNRDKFTKNKSKNKAFSFKKIIMCVLPSFLTKKWEKSARMSANFCKFASNYAQWLSPDRSVIITCLYYNIL